MVNSNGVKNPITKIMESLPWTPLKVGARILFFYEDAQSTKAALKILNRPNAHFSTLSGKKDLILKSTGLPIPLLHLEWGDSAKDAVHGPVEGKLHMWCLPASDPKIVHLERAGIKPKASGLIYHHGMKDFSWDELRTSEL
jgi:hypothetical protein